MALIKSAEREIYFKIVYYGTGFCGKTTNLVWIHQNAPDPAKGEAPPEFRDGQGFTVGDFREQHMFDKPGRYVVRVGAFSGKQKSLTETVVEVQPPNASTVTVEMRVADQGVQVDTRQRSDGLCCRRPRRASGLRRDKAGGQAGFP